MTRTAVWVLVVGGALLTAGEAANAATDPPPFEGRIEADRDTSVPAWPKAVKAPAGAPNIILILLDDVGYGATSVFGGPVATPELEALAADGLRYNNFHVNALCSPTRAALLTGRNNHQVGFGRTAEPAAGYPGYNSIWGRQHASIAQVLKQGGYSTAAFGKWHNTPNWEISPAGPFDRWPTGLGFEYFYGFQNGATSQFTPRLYRNTIPVEPAKTAAEGYHLTGDLVDDAIKWLHQHEAVAPDKPFFLYFATGATHSPHQVPQEWLDRYKGKFDQGWDKLREETFARQKRLGVIPANAQLTPRPAELPGWDSLSAEQKTLLARQQEIYAAFLAHTDHEIGRLLKTLKKDGIADNTLVLYIVGDNGGDGAAGIEGRDLSRRPGESDESLRQARLAALASLGRDEYNNLYGSGWAWAASTPFQWMKQVASHLGGTTDPLIVSWPAKIKDRGGLRGQFQHVTDIAPTLYELAGIPLPERVQGVAQAPLEGVSLAYTFDQANAPTRHRRQYFEMWGNRAIYQDGWWAGARHVPPWQLYSDPNAWFKSFSDDTWELYHLDEDFSQAHDLAAKNPEKLKELVAVFDSEARRNAVYPLLPPRGGAPTPARERTHVVYRDGVTRLHEASSPDLGSRPHTLDAEVVVPESGAEGVIIAQGGPQGGFSLYVEDGRPVYELNTRGRDHTRLVSSERLRPGRNRIVVDIAFDAADPGKAAVVLPYSSTTLHAATGRLRVNGTPVGEARLDPFGEFNRSLIETLDIGRDAGATVSASHPGPFPFTGTIEAVTVDVH